MAAAGGGLLISNEMRAVEACRTRNEELKVEEKSLIEKAGEVVSTNVTVGATVVGFYLSVLSAMAKYEMSPYLSLVAYVLFVVAMREVRWIGCLELKRLAQFLHVNEANKVGVHDLASDLQSDIEARKGNGELDNEMAWLCLHRINIAKDAFETPSARLGNRGMFVSTTSFAKHYLAQISSNFWVCLSVGTMFAVVLFAKHALAQ